MGAAQATRVALRRPLRAMAKRRPPGVLIAVLLGILTVAASSTLAGAQSDSQTVTVRMRGTTGEEQVRVSVDGLVVQDITVGASWQDYNFTLPPGAPSVQVEFRNDGLTDSGSDRNLLVDWVQASGQRIEAEAPTVLSKGVWNGTDCGEGYRQSQFLACNGWFLFDLSDEGTTTSTTTTTPPPDATIEFEVYARGTTGSEFASIDVNGSSVTRILLGEVAAWESIPIPTDAFIDNDPNHPGNVVRFSFVNDGIQPDADGNLLPENDRNIWVGSFKLDGTIFNPVDLKSKGSWNGTDCGEGFRNSNWLHCNGWFELLGADDPPPPPPPEETVLLAANMRGTTGTEEIAFEVNGEIVATANLDTEDQWFDVFVPLDRFVNDDAADPGNVVRVLFTNDGNDPVGGDRNVIATAFEFNGPIFNPRDLKTKGSWNGSDCGEGFRNSNTLHCNGWFEIVGTDTPPPPPPEDVVFLDVVARGTTGTELMSIEINGEVVVFENEAGELVSEFTLGTSITPYYFDIFPELFVNGDPQHPDNTVRVLFINDGRAANGGDRNVYFSEFAFDGTNLDPRTLKSKGSWNGTDCGEGFRNSNWLQCNGWFELAGGDDSGGGGGGDDDLPGTGKTITMGRANWESGYVHAQIAHDLLEELGYEVTSPADLELAPDQAYLAMAEGDMDFWANFWSPNHLVWWDGERSDGSRIGNYLAEPQSPMLYRGPAQGMVTSASWARADDITTLDQINADENLWRQLDSDGNGKGEFYGCPEQWLCDDIMDSQIAFAGWDNLEQVKGDYDEMFAQFLEKIESGQPAVMYMWAPTSYYALADFGNRTKWLPVNKSSVLDDSNPLGIEGGENFSQLNSNGEADDFDQDVDDCLDGPDGCILGWRKSTITAAFNKEWSDTNPAAWRLLDEFALQSSEVSHLLLEVQRAGGNQAALEDVVTNWIANNRFKVNPWLQLARESGNQPPPKEKLSPIVFGEVERGGPSDIGDVLFHFDVDTSDDPSDDYNLNISVSAEDGPGFGGAAPPSSPIHVYLADWARDTTDRELCIEAAREPIRGDWETHTSSDVARKCITYPSDLD